MSTALQRQEQQSKGDIEAALKAFAVHPLRQAGLRLLDALGYRSERQFEVSGLQAFRELLDQRGRLNDEAARTADWTGCEFLCQVTGEDIARAAQGALLFRTGYAPNEMQSYVFLAVDMSREHYTRTELAQITRAVNRVFDMPAMLIFKYGPALTLAIINRRLSKKDESRDVLEKVTLVKDISFSDPIRAHVEILHDLCLRCLRHDFPFSDFQGLHQAWERRLATYPLNEQFYREIADWYFWALGTPTVLPRSIEAIVDTEERERQRSIFFIRLLTRLIFCWFLREKGFLPPDLFRQHAVEALLNDPSPASGAYYKAVLQNLFFATLNQQREKRGWRKKHPGSRDSNRGITNLWRYQDLLADPDSLEQLLRDPVPFVNGGLFDCLDDANATRNLRLDDFSDEKGNGLCLPKELFFGEPRDIDLTAVYDNSRYKREKVSGLIEVLSRYKFTVEENTPLEEEIALDPELLGKVFENLLASYNEETRTTARKATGSYYTPRQIVRYMVDEALVSYLACRVPAVPEATLRSLFKADAAPSELTPAQKAEIVRAIGAVKILDPACGSGAFLMGALHRLVDLLQKLDPNNEGWKRDRLAEAERYRDLLQQQNAPAAELDDVEDRIRDIADSFEIRFHALDYARKLHLIEKCIFGVDIQPIACQIAKLRFFISLIVDQRLDRNAPNLGVRPLPNLETRIVAADSLVPVRRPGAQLALLEHLVDPLRRELEQVRHDHFSARTPARKARCRERDAALRKQIAEVLRQGGMPAESADRLASWDPYDQSHAARFFDSEWMFGLPVGKVHTGGPSAATLRGRLALVNEVLGQMELLAPGEFDSGFDVVIGNPPYVRIQTLKKQDAAQVDFYRKNYQAASKGNYDVYVVFVEAGLKLLKPDGHLAYILPHKFFNTDYGESLRQLIANRHRLQHVVNFGKQQVFRGSTNYVCLLFLAQAGTEGCRWVRNVNLGEWLTDKSGEEYWLPASTITSAEWNFAGAALDRLLLRIQGVGVPLLELPAEMSRGSSTGDDEVFIIDDSEAVVESALLRVPVFATDFHRFRFLRNSKKRIIFPYKETPTGFSLLQDREFRAAFPQGYAYLKSQRTRLEKRKGARTWYGFSAPRNLQLHAKAQLLVPLLAKQGSFAAVPEGLAGQLCPMASGGFTIHIPQTAPVGYKYVLGLLNSPVLFWVLLRTSNVFRNAWITCTKQYFGKLPIAQATTAQEASVVCLVDYLLWLNQCFTEQGAATDGRDAVMLDYWGQVLNGLVYELYFPDDLHGRGLHFFDLVQQAGLPELDAIPESRRLAQLRRDFERVYNPEHPLRVALNELQSVEVVRIIEGKV